MRYFRRIFQSAPRAIPSSILVITGICIFGAFIHADSWRRIISFSGLALAATTISLSVRDIKSLLNVFGIVPCTRKAIYHSMGGILFGLLLGVGYNLIKADCYFPHKLTIFALTAPLIGITEELVFRGFVQSAAAPAGALFSILLASSGHTAYKFFVIWTLPAGLSTDIPSLVVLTFVVGLIFGMMRKVSGSVIPPAVAHALFDVIVYGGASLVPVWIWS